MSRQSQIAAMGRELGNPHVRSNAQTNADGFRKGPNPSTTGGDSATGNKAGAPYHSRTMRDDGDTVERHPNPQDGNPYNPHDQDESGVLGPVAEVFEGTAPTIDSPTRLSKEMPDRFGNYKADAVASVTEATPAGHAVEFPRNGVMGRE